MEPLLSYISAFFSWFIDYTIDISIFVCIIFIIKSVVSKRLPAWWHYSLWVVLLIRMLIPWRYERTAQLPELIPIPLPDVHILDNMIMGKNTIVLDIAKGASENIHGSSVSFDEALLYTWITGAVLLGVYTLFRNMRFWIRIKQIPMVIDREILDLLEECKTRMKINTIVGITITDLVKSPALFGFLRPRLLLPEGVLEILSNEELTYVFMHELGHLKRHDNGISWIITFLQVFHWFNPFVWLAFYQMRIDQESACDASVLSKIGHKQPKDYAVTIVGFLEKFCQNSQLPAMAGIIENKSQMKRRIAMIVMYRKSTKKITITAIIMLLVTGFAFYTLTGFAQDTQINSNETEFSDELTEDAKKVMVEAQELYEGQDFINARILLLDYITANPDQIPAELYLQLGYCWYADQNLKKEEALDEALQVFEEGYEAYPDNFDLMSYYATVLYENEYFAEAAPLMEKLFEKDKNKKIRFLEAAYGAYYQTKSFEEVIRVLKKAISVSDGPKKEWYKLIYQIYFYELKDQEKAEDALNEGIEKYPDNSELLYLYSVLLHQTGHYSEAGPILEKASEMDKKKQVEYLEAAAVSYLWVKNYEEFIRIYENLISMGFEPRKFWYDSIFGIYLYEFKDLDKAEDILNVAIEKYPEEKSFLNFQTVLHREKEGYITPAHDESDSQYELALNFNQIDQPPGLIKKINPKYPLKAARIGLEGKVKIRYVISAEGHVQNPEVVESVHDGIFDESALEAIKYYEYTPAKKDGKNVACIAVAPISFSLSK